MIDTTVSNAPDLRLYARWSLRAIAVGLTLLADPVIAQSLVPDSVVAAPDVGAYLIMPIRCDRNGDMFVRPPLSKINSDGKRAATFDLSAAGQDASTNLVFKDFAIDLRGFVYQLVRTQDQHPAVVRFDGDGHYIGTVVLSEDFEPQQLGVFSSDAYLVSGQSVRRRGADVEFTPYAAMFDGSGRLIKNVTVPANLKSRDILQERSATGQAAASLDLGIMESDGAYIYLLRQGSTPRVLAISAAGDVDRVLTLISPYPDAHVSGFRVGAGQLLLEYAREKAFPNGNTAYSLVTYDAQTGSKLTEYVRDPELTGVLACTDWKREFSFLSSDITGRRVLLKAFKQ